MNYYYHYLLIIFLFFNSICLIFIQYFIDLFNFVKRFFLNIYALRISNNKSNHYKISNIFKVIICFYIVRLIKKFIINN